jgi:hypothetical protein
MAKAGFFNLKRNYAMTGNMIDPVPWPYEFSNHCRGILTDEIAKPSFTKTVVAHAPQTDLAFPNHLSSFSDGTFIGCAAKFPRPRRTAISSAAMLTAISAGVTAAISSPIGA